MNLPYTWVDVGRLPNHCRESTLAVLAGVENPHGHEELSTGALYLFQVG